MAPTPSTTRSLERVLIMVMCCEKYRSSKAFVLMQWLRQLHVATKAPYVFVFGNPDLEQPYERRGDDLVVRAGDDYISFNRKVTAALTWFAEADEFAHCTHVCKVDDDTLMHMKRFAPYLERAIRVPSCGVFSGRPPKNLLWHHGHYDLDLELGSYEGPYYEGPTYVLRRDVVEHFAANVTEEHQRTRQAEDKMVADVVRDRYPPIDYKWSMTIDRNYSWHEDNLYARQFRDSIVVSNVRPPLIRAEFVANAQRTVLCYWDKGYAAMPKALRRVCDLNYQMCHRFGYNLVVMDDTMIGEILELPECYRELAPNYKSDVVRWLYLNKYGGIWIDCDVLLLGNLDRHFNAPYDLRVFGESNSNHLNMQHAPTQTTYASCILVMRRNSCVSNFAVECLYRRLKGAVPREGVTEWTIIGPEVVADIVQAEQLANLVDLVPFSESKLGASYLQWSDVYSANDCARTRGKIFKDSAETALATAKEIRHRTDFFILWRLPEHCGDDIFAKPESVVHHLRSLYWQPMAKQQKPRLLMVISILRSGTQSFCRAMEQQQLGEWSLASYYEFCNVNYYNGKWGQNYFDRYGTSTKLNTLKRVLEIEHARRNVVVLKLFQGDHGFSNADLDEIIRVADVRFVFLQRPMHDVYSSLYRAFEHNDWTEKRASPLPRLPYSKMRENVDIKWLMDHGVHESFIREKMAFLESRGVVFQELHFADFTKWVRSDYHTFLQGLWTW